MSSNELEGRPKELPAAAPICTREDFRWAAVTRRAKLVELRGYSFPVRASPGFENRAQMIANRCERAYGFMTDLFGVQPEFSLLVLAPEHWPDRDLAAALRTHVDPVLEHVWASWPA